MTLAFVVNSGSSSIKWELLDAASGSREAGGIVERIGEGGVDHAAAMRSILDELGDVHPDVIGHRVVHGGALFAAATLVDDAVLESIEELSALAPLHNPANVAGIRAAREAFPGVPNVAVFDTAFHANMPPAAYTYAIDSTVAADHGVRRYGFHGTSYQYVSARAADVLGRPLDDLRLIVLHLGNGASVCAIKGGVSIDTSMGLTPLEGLVMGSRSGDVDAGILFHLGRAGFTLPELDTLLNRRSGMLGLAGHTDMRDVLAGVTAGDASSQLAFVVYVHRLRHYIGAYLAELGGADAIVFTAGVGENAAPVRAAALAGFEWAGIHLSEERNATRGTTVISTDVSPVAALVIPTNEELEIARQAAALL
ncbi:acetate kinase [Microbacteriaceae bacterium SG_E_30_P1]|uniref:Acetate kinase n=1 Tax=Antiquaquibacter oligotrophicus TaxID=2880260 RepID=A0ABT6KPH1_9MICO|nr:acetate kinase [Antiquaquibacter oligotrophicus]MDH6181890.1 acetate kinase [Antiquaquibacter oligotrophicus]UDF12437.1 acetate kinase [Antiquaquibacter oligotrophicus]